MVRGGGEGKFSTVGWGESDILVGGGGGGLPDKGNLKMSDFDASNLFQN